VVCRALICRSAAGLAAVLVAGGCAGAPKTPANQQSGDQVSSVITSTTTIGSAGVLGNQRRPDESCAPEPAPLDPLPPGPVRHGTGPETTETAVVADPLRIVALAGTDLDALCALGLQDRIVAAAIPDGAPGQPSYLGTVVHDLPAVGTRSAPDLAGVAAAQPDLILGAQSLTPDYTALAAIAPTVFASAPPGRWQDNLLLVGAATGRAEAARELVDAFAAQAREAGKANDAEHFQASVVQLTDSTLRVYGAENFPASVLAAVGVDRPPAQRFTDEPYLEIDLGDSSDFSAAEGDIIYLSFASPEAKDRAPQLLGSTAWRKLSANRDNRVFVVNNEVWQTGQGLVAARGIVDDLQWLNAPIN